MIDTVGKPRRQTRRIIALSAILVGALMCCGRLYIVKTHRDLNLQLLGAVKKNDAEAVRVLLARGANPNIRDVPQYRLSLWEQIQLVFHRSNQTRGHRRYMALELSENQMPTALFLAIDPWSNRDDEVNGENSENIPLVKALLDSGSRVEDSYYDHTTPLMEAVSNGRFKTAQLLLDHGANPFARDDRGQLSIHLVTDLKTTELLVKHGNDVNALDNEGRTPLMNVAGTDNIGNCPLSGCT